MSGVSGVRLRSSGGGADHALGDVSPPSRPPPAPPSPTSAPPSPPPVVTGATLTGTARRLGAAVRAAAAKKAGELGATVSAAAADKAAEVRASVSAAAAQVGADLQERAAEKASQWRKNLQEFNDRCEAERLQKAEQEALEQRERAGTQAQAAAVAARLQLREGSRAGVSGEGTGASAGVGANRGGPAAAPLGRAGAVRARSHSPRGPGKPQRNPVSGGGRVGGGGAGNGDVPEAGAAASSTTGNVPAWADERNWTTKQQRAAEYLRSVGKAHLIRPPRFKKNEDEHQVWTPKAKEHEARIRAQVLEATGSEKRVAKLKIKEGRKLTNKDAAKLGLDPEELVRRRYLVLVEKPDFFDLDALDRWEKEMMRNDTAWLVKKGVQYRPDLAAEAAVTVGVACAPLAVGAVAVGAALAGAVAVAGVLPEARAGRAEKQVQEAYYNDYY